jgi:hypothetical protein
LYQDVATILQAIHDSLSSKTEECLLFTKTVYCSVQASIAANIQLCDIIEVQCKKKKKYGK